MLFRFDVFHLISAKFPHFILYHNLRIMPIQLTSYVLSPVDSIPDSREWKSNWLLKN